MFVVMIVGFACSLYLLIQRRERTSLPVDGSEPRASESEPVDVSLGGTCMRLWFVALGDNLSDNFEEYSKSEAPGLATVVYLAWVLVSSVLMLNLLCVSRAIRAPRFPAREGLG